MSTPESTRAISQDRKKGKNVSALRGLLPFLKPYKILVATALFMLTFTAAISLILPLAVRGVVDGFSKDLDVLDDYFIYAIFVAGLLAVGSAVRYALVTKLGERVVADIRRAVYDKMIGMSPAFYEKIMTGEVLSRITTDTTLILSVIGSYLSYALRNAIMFVGGLILLFITSAKLTGLVLLIVPFILIPIFGIGRRVRVLSKINQDKIAESSGNASESLLASQTVQAFTHEAVSRSLFAKLTEEAYDATRKRVTIRALMTAIVIFLIFTGVVAVIWIGARDVKVGNMTAGVLVQFVIYAVLVGSSVTAFAEFWGEMQRAAGATERLIELLNSEDVVKDPERPDQLELPVKGGLEFENLSFYYPSRPNTAALDGFSLKVNPGETIALVGPSGAGKSTIFQLLMRFFDPTSGSIKLDGKPIVSLKREEFRKHLSIVTQDPVIFGTSAMENIRFGRPEATDEEVINAAKAAAAHNFLEILPDGYESFVGEQGVMLSGGQKQRLAIARAILRDAPVLLLDEATSALDAESEFAVQKAVEALARTRTTIIIAHRLATVKKADRIIVVDEGKIVAQGTHSELVSQGGLYARLAKLQFTDENN
ncbi:ABC transporter transmembrane domain-containing protein [Amylibacter sp.]|jgi:ATP-binding cassette subfamily B protein|nr:ABC transporter transmembrane domain-containing protein [Amylibacter sp.]MDA9074727.1 ABC transporter transmembrane domain-containing protein [Amylibacter sp.]MDA9242900.1 ABC transporter transmembrane domain-containing protein [Amylibacter sp.]MDA9293319.1 ABC transporter transmembrane domain-containing protein [Amylibacter sp.]MDA9300331.1 ABC transporter transmembrane domain-containing protein [Amylibacter sp.]|tara:strand:- start:8423 stop:10213 length:1791 start_codon:yes stop_codon:yes gene_type:complete